MNEKTKQIIEQINAIKLKLNKYTNLKLYDKVNEYLHNLSRFQLNDEILTCTDIMNCLKDMKNKENPAYSSKANDLMKKFRSESVSRIGSSDSSSKAMNVSNRSIDATKSVSVVAKNGTNKPNEVNKTNIKQSVPSTNQPKVNSTSSSSSSTLKKSIQDKNSIQNKKRPSTTNEKLQALDESLSKKPKLSLSDYKLLKGNNSESKSETLSDSRGSTSSSSSQYEVDQDSNLFDSYSPTPKVVLNEKPSSKPGSSLGSNDKKKIIMPPVPLVPLAKIIINESQKEPYEPIISTNLKISSTSSSTAGTSRNIISKFSSMLNNPTVQVSSSRITDDEVLTKIMREKGQKKQILYTGKRHCNGQPNQVPKLFDLSVRVLTDTLDDLPNRISIYNTTHDFPIAFDLIKPVLERTNAKQLESCENYSPNLLSDTDYIWKKLTERVFKSFSQPEEDESWREVYFKELDKREEEFQRARKLISSKQQAKPKERQTQLATVKFVSANRSVKRTTTSDSSGPVRTMVSLDRGGSSFNRSSNSSGGSSRFGPPQPAMSQGRKAIMKMIKKSTRR